MNLIAKLLVGCIGINVLLLISTIFYPDGSAQHIEKLLEHQNTIEPLLTEEQRKNTPIVQFTGKAQVTIEHMSNETNNNR